MPLHIFKDKEPPPKNYWKDFPQTRLPETTFSKAEIKSNILRNFELAENKLGLSRNGGECGIFTKNGQQICQKYTRLVPSDHGAYIEVDPKDINWKITRIDRHNFRNLRRPYFIKAKAYCMDLYIQLRTVADKPNPPPGLLSVNNNRIRTGYADYKKGFIYINCLHIKTTEGIIGHVNLNNSRAQPRRRFNSQRGIPRGQESRRRFNSWRGFLPGQESQNRPPLPFQHFRPQNNFNRIPKIQSGRRGFLPGLGSQNRPSLPPENFQQRPHKWPSPPNGPQIQVQGFPMRGHFQWIPHA